MDKPAVYRIKVRGVFPDSWIERMGGMQITDKTSESMTMEGRLPDQSALTGVLDTLFTLNLPILEVICLQEQ